MKNAFYNDIFEILLGKGQEGLPVGIIARQVYNRHTGLFSKDLTYEKIYQNVRFFLWSQAIKPGSAFAFGTQRGWYCLNPHASQQMNLLFDEQEPENMVETQEKKTDPYENHPTLF